MTKNSQLTKFSILLSLTTLFCQNLFAQTYCVSKGNSPWSEWIAKVQFGTINNASVKEGYGNFVSQTAAVNRGSSYPITVTQGFSWAGDPSNATQQGRVWIDYNQNGTFEPSERVASLSRNNTTAQILIPNDVPSGNTRMRIALKTIGIPTPCEIFDKGEVEDYTLNIGGGTTSNLPDLTLSNLNLTNPSVPQGQVLNYKFDLKNIGVGNASGSFNVKGYISRDNVLSPDDMQDGIVPTGNFNAGFSVLQVPAASTIPVTLAAGQYYLILKADADNQVVEHNENNNTIVSLPIQVTANGGTNCLNRFELEAFDYQQCIRNGFSFGYKFGTLQQYGQNLTAGFQLMIGDYINRAMLYTRNGVTTPPAGSNFKPCAANWIYFTAVGGNQLNDARSNTVEYPKVYIRIRTFGNALNPDSIYVEVDGNTINFGSSNFQYLSWVSVAKTKNCNPCFATDVTPPTVNNCPNVATVVYPTAYPSDLLNGYAITNKLGIQFTDNCTLSGNFQQPQYHFPNLLFAAWGTSVAFKTVQFDSAGNQRACAFQIKFVPDCATTPVTPFLDNCPANITVQAAAGQTCATASWIPPAVTYRLMPSTVTSNFQPGYCFPIGTTVVTYTATDSCGHVGKCNFNVTVTGQTSALPDLTMQLLESEPFSYPYFFNEPFARMVRVRARIQTTKFIPDDRQPNISYSKIIRFYLSTDAILSADDRLITNWGADFDSLITQLSILPVFEGLPNSVIQTVPSGNYYLIALVNAINQIAESNVANNVSNALPIELYQSKCVSKSVAPWNLWVSAVHFNTIHNTSTSFRSSVSGFFTTGYTNWQDKTTSIARNATYPLAVTNATAWATNPAPIFTRVWIDFNGDGDYLDAGEQVLQANASSSQNISANIVIPATARIGFTTMRVSSKFTNYAASCDTFDVGEVEDYGIFITNTTGLARANTAVNDSNSIDYDVKIFPNPATSEAFLDLKDFENELVELKVSDVAGKVLFNQTIEKASITPHRLNTASLKNGTYFIEIQSVRKRVTRKLYLLN